MYSLYDKISDIFMKLIKDKNQREHIIMMLENFSRNMNYDIPISLDLMFRADGHNFSKLLKCIKKDDLQPFSLNLLDLLLMLQKNFPIYTSLNQYLHYIFVVMK